MDDFEPLEVIGKVSFPEPSSNCRLTNFAFKSGISHFPIETQLPSQFLKYCPMLNHISQVLPTAETCFLSILESVTTSPHLREGIHVAFQGTERCPPDTVIHLLESLQLASKQLPSHTQPSGTSSDSPFLSHDRPLPQHKPHTHANIGPELQLQLLVAQSSQRCRLNLTQPRHTAALDFILPSHLPKPPRIPPHLPTPKGHRVRLFLAASRDGVIIVYPHAILPRTSSPLPAGCTECSLLSHEHLGQPYPVPANTLVAILPTVPHELRSPPAPCQLLAIRPAAATDILWVRHDEVPAQGDTGGGAEVPTGSQLYPDMTPPTRIFWRRHTPLREGVPVPISALAHPLPIAADTFTPHICCHVPTCAHGRGTGIFLLPPMPVTPRGPWYHSSVLRTACLRFIHREVTRGLLSNLTTQTVPQTLIRLAVRFPSPTALGPDSFGSYSTVPSPNPSSCDGTQQLHPSMSHSPEHPVVSIAELGLRPPCPTLPSLHNAFLAFDAQTLSLSFPGPIPNGIRLALQTLRTLGLGDFDVTLDPNPTDSEGRTVLHCAFGLGLGPGLLSAIGIIRRFGFPLVPHGLTSHAVGAFGGSLPPTEPHPLLYSHAGPSLPKSPPTLLPLPTNTVRAVLAQSHPGGPALPALCALPIRIPVPSQPHSPHTLQPGGPYVEATLLVGSPRFRAAALQLALSVLTPPLAIPLPLRPPSRRAVQDLVDLLLKHTHTTDPKAKDKHRHARDKPSPGDPTLPTAFAPLPPSRLPFHPHYPNVETHTDTAGDDLAPHCKPQHPPLIHPPHTQSESPFHSISSTASSYSGCAAALGGLGPLRHAEPVLTAARILFHALAHRAHAHAHALHRTAPPEGPSVRGHDGAESHTHRHHDPSPTTPVTPLLSSGVRDVSASPNKAPSTYIPRPSPVDPPPSLDVSYTDTHRMTHRTPSDSSQSSTPRPSAQNSISSSLVRDTPRAASPDPAPVTVHTVFSEFITPMLRPPSSFPPPPHWAPPWLYGAVVLADVVEWLDTIRDILRSSPSSSVPSPFLSALHERVAHAASHLRAHIGPSPNSHRQLPSARSLLKVTQSELRRLVPPISPHTQRPCASHSVPVPWPVHQPPPPFDPLTDVLPLQTLLYQDTPPSMGYWAMVPHTYSHRSARHRGPHWLILWPGHPALSQAATRIVQALVDRSFHRAAQAWHHAVYRCVATTCHSLEVSVRDLSRLIVVTPTFPRTDPAPGSPSASPCLAAPIGATLDLVSRDHDGLLAPLPQSPQPEPSPSPHSTPPQPNHTHTPSPPPSPTSDTPGPLPPSPEPSAVSRFVSLLQPESGFRADGVRYTVETQAGEAVLLALQRSGREGKMALLNHSDRNRVIHNYNAPNPILRAAVAALQPGVEFPTSPPSPRVLMRRLLRILGMSLLTGTLSPVPSHSSPFQAVPRPGPWLVAHVPYLQHTHFSRLRDRPPPLPVVTALSPPCPFSPSEVSQTVPAATSSHSDTSPSASVHSAASSPPRDLQPPPTAATPSRSPHLDDGLDDVVWSHWSCPRCTLINDMDAFTCAACDLPRPRDRWISDQNTQAPEAPPQEIQPNTESDIHSIPTVLHPSIWRTRPTWIHRVLAAVMELILHNADDINTALLRLFPAQTRSHMGHLLQHQAASPQTMTRATSEILTAFRPLGAALGLCRSALDVCREAVHEACRATISPPDPKWEPPQIARVRAALEEAVRLRHTALQSVLAAHRANLLRLHSVGLGLTTPPSLCMTCHVNTHLAGGGERRAPGLRVPPPGLSFPFRSLFHTGPHPPPRPALRPVWDSGSDSPPLPDPANLDLHSHQVHGPCTHKHTPSDATSPSQPLTGSLPELASLPVCVWLAPTPATGSGSGLWLNIAGSTDCVTAALVAVHQFLRNKRRPHTTTSCGAGSVSLRLSDREMDALTKHGGAGLDVIEGATGWRTRVVEGGTLVLTPPATVSNSVLHPFPAPTAQDAAAIAAILLGRLAEPDRPEHPTAVAPPSTPLRIRGEALQVLLGVPTFTQHCTCTHALNAKTDHSTPPLLIAFTPPQMVPERVRPHMSQKPNRQGQTVMLLCGHTHTVECLAQTTKTHPPGGAECRICGQQLLPVEIAALKSLGATAGAAAPHVTSVLTSLRREGPHAAPCPHTGCLGVGVALRVRGGHTQAPSVFQCLDCGSLTCHGGAPHRGHFHGPCRLALGAAARTALWRFCLALKAVGPNPDRTEQGGVPAASLVTQAVERSGLPQDVVTSVLTEVARWEPAGDASGTPEGATDTVPCAVCSAATPGPGVGICGRCGFVGDTTVPNLADKAAKGQSLEHHWGAMREAFQEAAAHPPDPGPSSCGGRMDTTQTVLPVSCFRCGRGGSAVPELGMSCGEVGANGPRVFPSRPMYLCLHCPARVLCGVCLLRVLVGGESQHCQGHGWVRVSALVQ